MVNSLNHKYKLIFIFFIIILLIIYTNNPVISLGLLVGIYFLFLSYKFPVKMMFFLIIALTISYENVFRFELIGFDLNSLLKLAILLNCFTLLNKQFINISRFKYIIIMFFLIFTQSIISLLLYNQLSLNYLVISFLGLLTVFLLVSIEWQESTGEKVLIVISCMPIISVAIGFILDLMGIWSFLFYEYTGVIRLRGAMASAHLAELCFYAIFTSIYLYTKKAKNIYILFVVINAVILILTFTRTAIFCSVIILLFLAFKIIKGFLKGSIVNLFLISIGSIGLLFGIGLILDKLLQRSEKGATSGREYAWQVYLSFAEGKELIGNGIGSTTAIFYNHGFNKQALLRYFLAPHNEYVRYYLELGIVGVVLIFGSILFLFYKAIKNTNRSIKGLVVLFMIAFLFLTYYDNSLTNIQSGACLMLILSVLISNDRCGKNGKSRLGNRSNI